MKKIVFGITSLDIGGAERVLVDLVNRLKDDFEITVFTIYGNGILEKELDPKIKRITVYSQNYKSLSLFERKKISLIFSSKFWMKKIYNKFINEKYDTEVAFLEGPITSLFATSSEAKKIAWVHTNMARHINNSIRKKQYSKDYQQYNTIVFVSNDALQGFNEIYSNDVDKKIIYNYLDANKVVEKGLEYEAKEISDNLPSFVSVCRLVKSKGLDRLLLVSKKLIENGYNHNIYIIGDGPEKENLEQMIYSSEMKEHFVLLGKRDNPYPYMKKGNYFILPSVYEGFGMVLLEAMIFNKDILVTDTGSKEAVLNYSKKLIIDNSFEGLYEGMKKFINKDFNYSSNQKDSFNFDDIIVQVKNIL